MVQWWRICLPVQETQETWVLFLGQGRSPGEGNGNPLQYSCLGNPVDRGAWWATVAKNQTQLTNWARARAHTHTHTVHTDYSFNTHLYWFLLSAKHCPGCQDSKWMRHRLQSVYSHLAAINGPCTSCSNPVHYRNCDQEWKVAVSEAVKEKGSSSPF